MAHSIEPLDSKHDRTGFECGRPSLNEFLARLATQYEKRNLARTYVLVRSVEVKVLGYYTLANSAIEFESLPPAQAKKLPRHPIPAVLLARLAVDQSCRDQGLGGQLLKDCFQRCLLLSDQIGIHSLAVDTIDDEATKFYEHFGFIRFVRQPSKLFIPITVIRKACGS